MQDETQKPWYREFWPWFVIALLGSAVIASLTTVVIAFMTAEPVLTMTVLTEGVSNTS